MIATIFKDLSKTNTPFFRDIDFILNRIKIGTSKDLVNSIRNEADKSKRNLLKSQLTAICFSGQFTRRADSAITEHSGIICLDFDNYNSIQELNKDLEIYKRDSYSYCIFISPSGNGFKLLVKIPPEIENHKQYFESLADYYNNPHFDTTSKNISRICFESYDENIYINKKSKLWTDKKEFESYNYIDKAPAVKLINENEIIKRIYKWFEKNYSFDSGQRNANLFILASALSDYGISKIETNRFCYQFEQKDFTQNEIERTISSAYSKCAANFGMKYFEDKESLDFLKKEIKSGKTLDEIKKSLPQLDQVSYEEIKEVVTINNFWHYSKKGSVIIDSYSYKMWLESNGFYKYYPDGADGFVFIRVENNLIDNTSEEKLKDFVLYCLLKASEFKVYEFLASNSKFFKEDYLNLLDNINVQFKDDTIDTGYIYFKNCAVLVTPADIKLIDYMDLGGFVWKKHIIDYVFEKSKTIECDFKKFISLVSNSDITRSQSLETTIGYLMHSFKTSANNKAIILNDETISENPNGGSGKGIFWNALSKVKRVADINGKSFSFDKTFPYQTVSADTQILVFDDVNKNFKFENLFSVITEGITLEKKNKDAIKVPVSKSPKIIITTNYTIGGVGGSFERRKWELEFSSHFSSKHTPLNEFGKMLFDEWNDKEWLKFYNYMIHCLQMYLSEGLVKHDFQNLETRKFIKETSFEFYEWCHEEDNIEFNARLYKSTLFNRFIEEYPDFKKWLSQKKFWQWIDIYISHYKYDVIKSRDITGRYIEISKGFIYG
jgi:hypothetical protein